LEWEFPEDSILNAQGDVPTSLAPFTECVFAHAMFLCGARMSYHVDPLRAQAAWCQGFGAPIYAGVNQWGEPFADLSPEVNATGAGARPDIDGVDGAGSWFATMSDCSDVETTESDHPFLYVFRNYSKQSCGHGKFRGGAGVGMGIMMHHVPWVAMGSIGYGSKFPSTRGIFGGYAAAPMFIHSVHGSNMKDLLKKGDVQLPRTLDELLEADNPERGKPDFRHITMPVEPFMNSETFYVACGAGAGYGDPVERDPKAVVKDLRDGMTTHWAAQNIYYIAYDEKTMRLDMEKTNALRDKVREERKKRGKPYDEFQKDWLKHRPPDEAIKYYGTYPNPSEEIKTVP